MFQMWDGCRNKMNKTLTPKTRIEILQRDNFLCIICKLNDRLEVHHEDKNRQNNHPRNLFTFCKPCHMFIHSNLPTCPV